MSRCIRCGAELPHDATRRRVFCSGPCRSRYHRERLAREIAELRRIAACH